MTIRVSHGANGWQLAVSAYAACQGASWVFSPDLFSHLPSYAFLAVQPFSQILWGSVLLVYSLANIACFTFKEGSRRAALGVVGTVIWLYLGTEMLAASITGGFRYPTGLFELIAGAGCAMAAMQRAHTP